MYTVNNTDASQARISVFHVCVFPLVAVSWIYTECSPNTKWRWVNETLDLDGAVIVAVVDLIRDALKSLTQCSNANRRSELDQNAEKFDNWKKTSEGNCGYWNSLRWNFLFFPCSGLLEEVS